jgi:DNA-directed RNA polymerase subunit beta'
MRGLMNKTFNYGQKTDSLIIRDTMEIPIKSSLIEGVNVLEYFNACYGTRKSMSDVAMKTSKSGYLTRKLVDSAQDVIVYKNDCGTTKGKMISAITNTDGVVIEKLSERIANRYASMEIVDPKTKKTLVNSGEIITESLAKKIEDLGIKEVEVRSTIHCLCENGVCQKCFGNDLVTKKIIDIGTPIGVVAAQSIGEPATQLNMKSKTTGGARGVGNIAQGFERLKQLLDVITPKEYETAIISTIYGTVTSIKISDEKIIEVKNDNNPKEIIAYKAPINLSLKVTVGSKVVPGDFISYGSANIQELLQISGIEKTREYILQEAQQIYRLQGIEVSDKYLEIIIRQMTNKMKVLDIGDSKLFVGQIIDIVQLIEENKKLLIANKKPINAISLVFGLDYIPSKTSSFLSAASFQDTKKILTDVAINGRKDYLLSLKENVMLGNLIPAGTGFNKTTDEIIKEGEEMFKKEY